MWAQGGVMACHFGKPKPMALFFNGHKRFFSYTWAKFAYQIHYGKDHSTYLSFRIQYWTFIPDIFDVDFSIV
jgi:hypothetical protein